MIKWFESIEESEFNLVGGKGYNLSKMYNHGIKVPNGFLVTSQAYDSYVEENQIKQELTSILNSDRSNPEKSKDIKVLFSVSTFPEELKKLLFYEMGKMRSGRVAVRSSATVEDLPGMSFAGQYDSYLNVTEKDLIEKIVLCWQSLWNERAIEYREKHNMTAEYSLGVVIQEMIEAKRAGIVFTANPINGSRNEMVINASYGLGEAIVSGKVNPDQYILEKNSGTVIKEDISVKEIKSQYSNDGIEYTAVDKSRMSVSSLEDKHIKTIVKEADKIQSYFGKPQDIEFAFDEDDELFIVQSRDITTLFPIDSFQQDGKLRCYLSAGTVMLGIKEPLTPLGYDLLSHMYPTIINVMTMRRKPLGNSFVKYAAGRLYMDITYLLASKFVAKQFAKAFAGNDLPLKDTMLNMIEHYGDIFKKQGIRFKIPWGALRYGIKISGSLRKIKKIPNEERYDVIIHMGEQVYQKWLGIANNLKTLNEKVDFIYDCLVDVFILSQKQGLYCLEMNDIEKIKKKVKKMYGDRFPLENLIHSLPGCVTQELTIKMNQAAQYFDEKKCEPEASHPKVEEILKRFGQRGNIELDFGTPRWGEEPGFIINQIKSYMFDKMYQRNLADVHEKAKRAEGLIEEIYQTVKEDYGEKKAQKLKTRMINYRIAAGMREYPKFDIVRLMGIARKVMLGVGEEFAKAGLIDRREEVFFLFKEDILNKENLRAKIAKNQAYYQKEMSRTSIPRLVLNTGETYYSAQKIEPDRKVLQGMPLSPGLYEGNVRIVLDPNKSSLLEGEIMVTESTNPSWTPLFATAKGLIMEYGGPVSHGGIVAREYGIPAVVGISSAANILKDGQRVRINGEAGTIEIL